MSDGRLLICLASAGLLLLARFFPFDRVPIAICPLRTLAHLPCPACGMTRAFMRFTHGQWASALHVSPLGTILASLATMVVFYGLLRATVLKRGVALELTSGESTAWRVALVVAVATNWAYLLVSGAAT